MSFLFIRHHFVGQLGPSVSTADESVRGFYSQGHHCDANQSSAASFDCA